MPQDQNKNKKKGQPSFQPSIHNPAQGKYSYSSSLQRLCVKMSTEWNQGRTVTKDIAMQCRLDMIHWLEFKKH